MPANWVGCGLLNQGRHLSIEGGDDWPSRPGDKFAPLGLNLTGNRDLSPDGIERDNTAPNVQQFKQRREWR